MVREIERQIKKQKDNGREDGSKKYSQTTDRQKRKTYFHLR